MASYSYQCLTGEGSHRDGLVVAVSREQACAQLEGKGWRVLVLQAVTAETTPAGGWARVQGEDPPLERAVHPRRVRTRRKGFAPLAGAAPSPGNACEGASPSPLRSVSAPSEPSPALDAPPLPPQTAGIAGRHDAPNPTPATPPLPPRVAGMARGQDAPNPARATPGTPPAPGRGRDLIAAPPLPPSPASPPLADVDTDDDPGEAARAASSPAAFLAAGRGGSTAGRGSSAPGTARGPQVSGALAAAAAGVPRLSGRPLTLLTLQLDVMLNSGFSYTRTLHALMASEDLKVAQVARRLHQAVEAGCPISAAMASMPHVFCPFYVMMVRLGEKSGSVPQALHDLTDWLKEQEGRKNRIASGLMYPAFVLAACTAMVALLVYYMLPQYMTILTDSGAKIPLLTRTLMSISGSPWLLVIPVSLIGGAIALGAAAPHHEPSRRFVERLQYDAPLLRTLFRDTLVASVCRNLAMLMQAGVTTLDAMRTIRTPSTGWSEMDKAIRASEEVVKNGMPLAAALEAGGLFPKFVISSARSGEKSARVPDMLGRAASILDQRVEVRLDSAIKMLEPLIMLVMGIIVAIIVLAAFLPIFELIQTL